MYVLVVWAKNYCVMQMNRFTSDMFRIKKKTDVLQIKRSEHTTVKQIKRNINYSDYLL